MRPDVVSLTERLVRVDSAPGRPTLPVVGVLAEELRALGAVVRLQDGSHDGVPQRNLVARFGGDAPAGLVLAGHIDTVPWSEGARATTSPERDGTRLYGRGTADMKGAVAAQLEAAASMAEALRRPVVLAWTYAEEIGCHGALHLVAERSLLGDVSDAVCLVGEPTDCTPIVAHKGYGVVSITLHGEAAHSSDPWAGADASQALGTLLRDLHELRETLRQDSPLSTVHEPPCTTINTGLVQAGTARNLVPPRASVEVEYRPLPGVDLEELQRRIQACVDLACASAPGVTCEMHWEPCRPAFDQTPAARVVEWLVERTGKAPGAVPFYTEAELYREGFGTPTVVCGPGSIRQAHRADEWISFDALGEGQELYRAAIEAFCT
jgi:acetylornithine deacetylase